MKLEDLKSGSNIVIESSGERYELITADWVGDDAVTALLRAQDQQLEERVFYRPDESRLSFPEKEFSWSFSAPLLVDDSNTPQRQKSQLPTLPKTYR